MDFEPTTDMKTVVTHLAVAISRARAVFCRAAGAFAAVTGKNVADSGG